MRIDHDLLDMHALECPTSVREAIGWRWQPDAEVTTDDGWMHTWYIGAGKWLVEVKYRGYYSITIDDQAPDLMMQLR